VPPAAAVPTTEYSIWNLRTPGMVDFLADRRAMRHTCVAAPAVRRSVY